MRIEIALELSDYDLWEIFEGSTTCKDGAEVRAHLECRKAYGDIFLGSENCEGFSPITGCPGHEAKDSAEDMPVTALIAIKELSRKKSEVVLNGVVGLAKKEAYQEAINIIREVYKRELEVCNG